MPFNFLRRWCAQPQPSAAQIAAADRARARLAAMDPRERAQILGLGGVMPDHWFGDQRNALARRVCPLCARLRALARRLRFWGYASAS